MEVSVFTPVNDQLRKCIECFYLLRQGENDSSRYISFPSVFTNLSVLQGAKINFSEAEISIEDNHTISPAFIIRKNLLKACIVEYKGKVDEITIFFKPLGIDHFPVLNAHIISTNQFITCTFSPDLVRKWNNIFSTGFSKDRLVLLEIFLLQFWQPFEHPFLYKAMEEIEIFPSITNALLASKLGISRKTLYSHFEKWLSVSPSGYRKIMRFRNSIKEKQKRQTIQNLTSLAHAMDFFDQSHMIKDFKSLTGYMPKEFFRKIHSPENSSISWIFQ